MSEEITPTEVALIELANEEHVKLVRCQAEKASLIFEIESLKSAHCDDVYKIESHRREIERLKAERQEIWDAAKKFHVGLSSKSFRISDLTEIDVNIQHVFATLADYEAADSAKKGKV